ncbi:hypothetical protein SAICODRAFT_28809 [Saitoella complicata NRRL Y-17804]|uniref:uncharacterized protein n=1 Tax=Saitoella complicata (strain BCRC 22490 / CBS 7301 / JCM 7358 / NBRC 10748 / NRRL Y-17804) TaxID=698492 RepID=UPI0008679706|nr:uncharacterized protein SAICODRAFT_28809 [Saitoella complicata NRRL Y-17804]ODQ55776.1 hypothetical protein SAICODRAFT_28809 [Saitoella complicata NRRL Y-17804]
MPFLTLFTRTKSSSIDLPSSPTAPRPSTSFSVKTEYEDAEGCTLVLGRECIRATEPACPYDRFHDRLSAAHHFTNSRSTRRTAAALPHRLLAFHTTTTLPSLGVLTPPWLSAILTGRDPTIALLTIQDLLVPSSLRATATSDRVLEDVWKGILGVLVACRDYTSVNFSSYEDGWVGAELSERLTSATSTPTHTSASTSMSARTRSPAGGSKRANESAARKDVRPGAVGGMMAYRSSQDIRRPTPLHLPQRTSGWGGALVA